MTDALLRAHLVLHTALRRTGRRAHADQRGEGVISAAIAVLIMAFLGASMWVLFDRVFEETNQKTENQVELIGR